MEPTSPHDDIVSQFPPSVTLLQRQQRIERPLAEVFAFFADAANLQAITPAWLGFEVLTRQPIEIKNGALIEYRIRLFGVPLRWQTVIESWQPPHEFVDRQLRGPYAYWHHTHQFKDIGGAVLMTDSVRYRVPWGPLGSLAKTLFVRRWLDEIFDFRHDRIAQLLSTVQSAHA